MANFTLVLITLFSILFKLVHSVPVPVPYDSTDVNYNDLLLSKMMDSYNKEIVKPYMGKFTRAELFEKVDQLLYNTSIHDFVEIRETLFPDEHAPDDPERWVMDWHSDGCETVPDNPFGFKFKPACQRRDFGIQNYIRQDRYNGCDMFKLDRLFYWDLQVACKEYELQFPMEYDIHLNQVGLCYWAAGAYHEHGPATFILVDWNEEQPYCTEAQMSPMSKKEIAQRIW